jgi:hypothetical protein
MVVFTFRRVSFIEQVNIEAVCEELDTLVKLKKAYDEHEKGNGANVDPLDKLTVSLNGNSITQFSVFKCSAEFFL